MQNYLQTLADFYPVSSQQTAVLRLLKYTQAQFAAHGLYTKILKYQGVHNLYATTTKSKHSRLLLQAHADVVPGLDQPFQIQAEKYLGRGSYDMLFAIACYLQLCDELGEQLTQLDLAFMLSGDEELGGFHGVKNFLEDGYNTDICILPDAGMGFGTLNVAAKGIYNCTIRIDGQSHHGSRPWEGDGAATKLIHFLTELENLFDQSNQDNSTMTIAKLTAGDADNRGPAQAEAIVDIRYKDQADLQRIKHSLGRLLKKYTGEITLLLEGKDYQLDTTNPYVASFLKLYKQHVGRPIKFVKAHGSSDARFFAERSIPVIMLRPDGGGAHGDNEWILAKSIDKFYQLLKEYVLKTATIGDNT